MKARNNDQKKVMILGALMAVMLAVGAFQLTGGGSAPVEAPAKEETVAENEESPGTDSANREDGTLNVDLTQLPQRDPFAPQISTGNDTTVAQNTPPAAPTPSAGIEPMAPPMPPMPGEPDELPMPSMINDGSGPGEIAGEGDANSSSAPSLRLSGVVLGDQPLALIQIEDGRQRTVRVGDIVADHEVTRITRTGVTLVGRGGTFTLALKGNAEN